MNTLVAVHKPTKNTNNVWLVYIPGQNEGRQFCKSAFSAMKYMFILKARTGANISDNCLQRLSFEIARIKAAGKAKIEAIAEEIAAQYDAKPLLEQPAKPKAKRGRPKKKAA